MRRRRKVLPFADGLGVWLAVALPAIAAILLFTNLASAQQSTAEGRFVAPALAAGSGEEAVGLGRDAVRGAARYDLSAWTGAAVQQQQDVDPVYITTVRPPSDGSQQAIVMPSSVTVSDDDPWFGPFYTVNDPDRDVGVDILNEHGFAVAVTPSAGLCSLPGYIDSSYAIGYQTAATKGFYVRRCPGFEHLTVINLSVTTYPDSVGYTTHRIRIISDSDPTPTATRTATPTTSSSTATPTATLVAEDAAGTATPTATATIVTQAGSGQSGSGQSGSGQSGSVLSVPVLTAEGAESAVELSWTVVAGALRYELWVWDSVNEWQQLGGDSLTETAYTHSGVTAGRNYYYTVRAVNAGQASDWSPYLAAAVPAAVSGSALSAPLLIAAAAQGRVELSWGAVADAVRYELWVWDSVDEWQRLGGVNLTGTAYTHSGVTAGTTYFYTIRAVNGGGGTSDWLQNLEITAQ